MAEEKRDTKVNGPAFLAYENPFKDELIATANKIATKGKGILAADESTGTIGKRFASIGVKDDENFQLSRKYRNMLFTTQGIENYISGVILFEKTLNQATIGAEEIPFAQYLTSKGIVPGIKVDKGTRALPYKPGEKFTQGLTDLDVRCKEYYQKGARFAKWRAVCTIQDGYVSQTSIAETAWTLARYAAICQVNGLVPIVEPELLMDGEHTVAVCQYWTEKIITACYKALSDQEVILEGTLLKPNMVLPGAQCKVKSTIKENALATVTALRRSVPAAVPGITFLSGGQSEMEATMHLNAINQFNLPWKATFSFGRALQASCLKAWQGKDENMAAAKEALLTRAKLNSDAQEGKYDPKKDTKDAQSSLYEKGYTY